MGQSQLLKCQVTMTVDIINIIIINAVVVSLHS
jgi:hypothetical protein